MAEAVKVIAANRKAYHEYFVLEKIEAGISLAGTEVKSIRMGHCSIKESYVSISHDEAVICGMNISPYEKGNIFNRDPVRDRKLLMHKSEVRRLGQKIREKGLTLVPLQVYLKGSLVKVEVGLVKGKKLYDKRDAIAEHDAKREAEREMKSRRFDD
ncbi:MAG: SsrA-binding protein SmpB [Lachnospiraceae bacterium]|nr:SsrA-binding protein SmpB [Lachnospiraceae bacterium]